MTDDFILKFDVEWASGKQAQLGNLQQSRPGPAKGKGRRRRAGPRPVGHHRRNVPVNRGPRSPSTRNRGHQILFPISDFYKYSPPVSTLHSLSPIQIYDDDKATDPAGLDDAYRKPG